MIYQRAGMHCYVHWHRSLHEYEELVICEINSLIYLVKRFCVSEITYLRFDVSVFAGPILQYLRFFSTSAHELIGAGTFGLISENFPAQQKF